MKCRSAWASVINCSLATAVADEMPAHLGRIDDPLEAIEGFQRTQIGSRPAVGARLCQGPRIIRLVPVQPCRIPDDEPLPRLDPAIELQPIGEGSHWLPGMIARDLVQFAARLQLDNGFRLV